MVRINHLHFAGNVAFRGTSHREFETHITLLYSVLPCNFDSTSHGVVTEEDKGSRRVRSRRITFMTADVTQAILEISSDGVSAPIAEVACHAYGIL